MSMVGGAVRIAFAIAFITADCRRARRRSLHAQRIASRRHRMNTSLSIGISCARGMP
jgi:hypothetical protein